MQLLLLCNENTKAIHWPTFYFFPAFLINVSDQYLSGDKQLCPCIKFMPEHPHHDWYYFKDFSSAFSAKKQFLSYWLVTSQVLFQRSPMRTRNQLSWECHVRQQGKSNLQKRKRRKSLPSRFWQPSRRSFGFVYHMLLFIGLCPYNVL